MGTCDRMLNEFVTVRVTKTLLKQMEAFCQKEQTTTSVMIREAITDKMRRCELEGLERTTIPANPSRSQSCTDR